MRLLFVPGEIGMREHCHDRIEPFIKHPGNPVMVADKPWESALGAESPCVLYSREKKLYEMWYIASNTGPFATHPGIHLVDNWSPSGRWFICYARSPDGVHWEKPALGIVGSKEYPDNNIVIADSGLFLNTATVIIDDRDPDPYRRYKMFMYDHDGAGRDGARTAVSPDGVHWQFVGDFPLLPCQDSPSLWHDRRNGLFVAFLKTRLDNRRARMVSVSADFATWSDPTVLFVPDLADAATVQFYDQVAFHHAGHDFGLLSRLDLATQKIDVELIASQRGGADWRRLPTRPVVLSPGNPGDWDGWMARPGMGGPIETEGLCRLYYTGGSKRHDIDTPWSVGIATFTPGRLAGQQFEGEGWFTSAPFRCLGGEVAIDAVSTEPLAVEVVGASYGGILKGYSRQECTAVSGDRPDHPVRWQAHATLDELKGTFVALRVHGKGAIVYGADIR